jgi:hypothetical protein
MPFSTVGPRALIRANHVTELQEAAAPLAAPGAEGKVLGISSGIPDWVDPPAGASASAITYDVLNHGVSGIPNLVRDNTTDNRQRLFDLIETVGVLGPARLYFPGGPGKYLFSTLHGSTHSVEACLPIRWNNITFQGDGRSTVLRFTGSSGEAVWYIAVNGGMKPTGDFDDIFTNRLFDGTIYTMTTADAGDNTITLATAADAANFAAGDWCAVMTGQTLAAPDNEQPDGEINQILAANAGTGVLTLRWPLAKPYRQEYYVSGTTGLTTTTVTANAARFGVKNANDRMVENFALHDMHIEQTGSENGAIVHHMGLVGYKSSNVTWDIQTNGVESVGSRLVRASNHDFVFHDKTDMGLPIGGSCFCTDWQVSSIEASSNYIPFLHFHEGCADMSFNDITLRGVYDATETFGMVDVTARAYNLNFDNISLTGGGPTTFFVGTDCDGGGRITNLTINSSNADVAISINSPNWHVDPPKLPTVAAGVGKQLIQFISPVVQPVQVLEAWIEQGDTTVTLGTLPGPFSIINIFVVNTEGWDDPYKFVNIGVNGNTDRFAGFSTAMNTTGVKTITTYGAGFGYYNTLPDTIIAACGTGGSTGKSLVILQYVQAPWG